MPRCPLVPARLRKAELSQGLTPEAFVDYDGMQHTFDETNYQFVLDVDKSREDSRGFACPKGVPRLSPVERE